MRPSPRWLSFLLVLAGIQACCQPEPVVPYMRYRAMVVGPDMSWRYFIGNSEPSADWRRLTFDDSEWTQGTGGIGYGDSDDGTIIERSISVYLRQPFTLEDPSQLTSMDFYIDYDDAFVAYINDVEIARSDGLRGAHPPHEQRSTVSHEALLYQGGVPDSNDVPLDVLQPGENILAIQVHNASLRSSDLSSSAYLIAETTADDRDYLPLPDWLGSTIEVMGSNLPIVVITTEDDAVIPDEPKSTARMGIINNPDGRRNYDRSFIRTPIAHQMSRMMGHYSSRTVHCELVINGEYLGVYIFMEKIKRDRNRVNVMPLGSTDVSGAAVTGGYIYEYSERGDGSAGMLNLRYPRPDHIRSEQVDYIVNYDSRFRDVMRGSSLSDPVKGYPALIDVGSFVDEILLQEIAKNVDAYVYSSFFHKDRSAKLAAGPVWDFDQSFGNSTKWRGDLAGGWIVKRHDLFWRILFEDDDFQRILKVRWHELREGPFRTDAMLDLVDSMAKRLQEAQRRNFRRWPTIGEKIWREPPALVGIESYEQEIVYLKEWIAQRTNWLDRALSNKG